MNQLQLKQLVRRAIMEVIEGPNPNPCPPVSCKPGLVQDPNTCKCVRASSLYSLKRPGKGSDMMREEEIEKDPCEDECKNASDCPPGQHCSSYADKSRGCNFCVPSGMGKTSTTDDQLIDKSFDIDQQINEQNPGSAGPGATIQNPVDGNIYSCNTTTFSNWQGWASTWLNSSAFSSPNPKQPCNHICKKRQQWGNKITNVGPSHQNQLACKIGTAGFASTQYQCNC